MQRFLYPVENVLHHVKIVVESLNNIIVIVDGTCMVVWCFVNVSTDDIISSEELMFVL